MLENSLNLYYSAISVSVVTIKHALLTGTGFADGQTN